MVSYGVDGVCSRMVTQPHRASNLLTFTHLYFPLKLGHCMGSFVGDTE